MFSVNTFTQPTEQQEPVFPVRACPSFPKTNINRLHAPTFPPGRRAPSTRLYYDSPTPNTPSNRRDPAGGRTPDYRPIRSQCGAVGHTARYSSKEWNSRSRAFTSNNHRSSFGHQFFVPPGPNRQEDGQSTAPPRSNRSPSPRRRQAFPRPPAAPRSRRMSPFNRKS